MPARRPTIRDVARVAGVSTVTVSRVCNEPDKVVIATRERVREAMRELGYVPNLAARTMRTQATRTIGFLIPDLTSYPNAAVAQAAIDHLALRGYAILLASSDQQPQREIEALAILRTRQVDGIILYACDQEHPGLRAAVAGLDVPCVLLDREMPGHADRIFSDHAAAMNQAVERLIALGHRRLALLQRATANRPTVERRQAFVDTGTRAGVDLPDLRALLLPEDDRQIQSQLDALFEGATPVTAVVAEGSHLLLTTIRMLKARGLDVPSDVSLIGIDADDVARAATPEIGCILRDFEAIGQAAATTMLARLTDRDTPPSAQHLPSWFVERQSVAAPK